MSKPIYVLGAGGHAKVVIDALLSQGVRPTGIVDPIARPGQVVLGVEVVGGDEVLEAFAPDTILLANGVGATPKSRVNTKLFEIWTRKGYQFTDILHSSAIISPYTVRQEGAQIMAGTVLQAEAVIGAGSVINTGARIDHDCIIGQHCFVAPSVTLCGGVKIGERTFIGAGAVLLPGVNVGHNVLIAANVVVDSDIADGSYVPRV